MHTDDDTPFESEVSAYEEADRLHCPPKAPVLFYGSSSLRFWPDLNRDFPGRPVLNRGFGGATFSDCLRLFDRLVRPYAPRVIVLYAGDNDLAHGHSPREVVEQLKQFLMLVSTQLPSARTAVISIKPSPLEWNNLRRIQELNTLMQDLVSGLDRVAFLDVFSRMSGPDGSCSSELFQEDGVHMAPAGYAVWKDAVTAYLNGEGAGFLREEHRWFSPRLQRDMGLLMLGSQGRKVLVFPTLYGSLYQYEELGMVEALRERLERGALQLLCVDSLDLESWYNRDRPPRERVLRHLDFEQYVLQEVLPFWQSRNADPTLTAHGCSLGAYHAVNIAFRHPDRFDRVLALAGRYDLTKSIGGFRDLVDGWYDDDVYFNTPCHFLANLTDPRLLEQLRSLAITIVIGDSDAFIDNNRAFSQTLWDKGIWHDFRVLPGHAHSPTRWCELVHALL